MRVTIFGSGYAGLVTGRTLYDPALMNRLGFDYFGIGRGSSIGVPAETLPDGDGT